MQHSLKRTASLALSLLFLTADAPGLPQSTARQDAALESSPSQSPEARTRERYDAAEWQRGPLVPGIPLGELQLAPFEGDALEADSGVLTRTFSSPGAKAPAIQVEARVFGSAVQAHDEVVVWLTGVSSSQRVPALSALGDAAYGATSPKPTGPTGWVVFVRGNVAVSLTVLDPRLTPNLDLLPLARTVDASILALTPETPLEQVQAPEIRQLLVPLGAKGPAPVALGVDALGPDGLPCHLHWKVSGPGQGYVQKDRGGAWQFHPTGPGKVTLTVEATSRLGVVTRASSHVIVTR